MFRSQSYYTFNVFCFRARSSVPQTPNAPDSLYFRFTFFHRARAAFLADWLRCSGVSLRARALPPAAPPLRPRPAKYFLNSLDSPFRATIPIVCDNGLRSQGLTCVDGP